MHVYNSGKLGIHLNNTAGVVSVEEKKKNMLPSYLESTDYEKDSRRKEPAVEHCSKWDIESVPVGNNLFQRP